MSGQLFIGGHGPALGYLGDDPEGRFQRNNDEAWYATGDVVRMDIDGSISFLGREDDQLKIAGHRVEPGEVEAALLKIDGVEQVAVIAENSNGVTALRCFVVADQEGLLSPEVLHERSGQILPSFMIPSTFEFLDDLPVTANGKLDRRGLSLRPRKMSFANTEAVGTVANLVGSILKSTVGDSALPLHQQGLDSIGAIDLQLEINRLYSKQIPVRQLQRFTITELEDFLEESPVAELPSSELNEADILPEPSRSLNSLESDLLAHVASSPQGAFHLAWRITFDRVVDTSCLQRALERIRDQHETLRTARSLLNGVRVIDSADMPNLHMDSLASEPSSKVLGSLLKHTLDIERGECIRALNWSSHNSTTLLVVVHHIAIDGRSAATLMSSLVNDKVSIQKPPAYNMQKDLAKLGQTEDTSKFDLGFNPANALSFTSPEEEMGTYITIEAPNAALQKFASFNNGSNFYFGAQKNPFVGKTNGLGVNTEYSIGNIKAVLGYHNSEYKGEELDNELKTETIAASFELNTDENTKIEFLVGTLDEQDTFLFSKGEGALGYRNTNPSSLFTGLNLGKRINNLSVSFSGTLAQSKMDNASHSLIEGTSNVISSSMNASVSLHQLGNKNNKLSFSVSQPNRIEQGALKIRIPGLADVNGNIPYAYKDIELESSGRQLDLSVNYIQSFDNNIDIGINLNQTQDYNHVNDNNSGINLSVVGQYKW